jgi:hypothetical protein
MRVEYDNEHPLGQEVNLGGSQDELLRLGEKLHQIACSFSIDADEPANSVWPHTCRAIDFELFAHSKDSLLYVKLQGERFCIAGSAEAFAKLGQSLINVFEKITIKGQHFHLDYFEGVPGLIAPTKISLIVSCEDTTPTLTGR